MLNAGVVENGLFARENDVRTGETRKLHMRSKLGESSFENTFFHTCSSCREINVVRTYFNGSIKPHSLPVIVVIVVVMTEHYGKSTPLNGLAKKNPACAGVGFPGARRDHSRRTRVWMRSGDGFG